MPDIKFYANIKGTDTETLIDHTASSGIGFFGNGFGTSVPIGEVQTTTFVTNNTGTTEAAQLNNTGWLSASTVSVNGTSRNLNNLPNYLCPLNVRFESDTTYKVQNCKLRIFDRSNIENHATGVSTYVYEARHPSTDATLNQLAFRGRSANTWVEFTNGVAMADMVFTNSPGMSGVNTSAADTDTNLGYQSQESASHSSTRHDWFVALSSEPETVGSKTQYGLYFTVEYLS
tara:strand:+ start:2752 stop:3444 length:693 start_codon:yes stop_codon:yes gene_type:complete